MVVLPEVGEDATSGTGLPHRIVADGEAYPILVVAEMDVATHRLGAADNGVVADDILVNDFVVVRRVGHVDAPMALVERQIGESGLDLLGPAKCRTDAEHAGR